MTMVSDFTSSFIAKNELFYEGIDLCLQDTPRCATCHSRPASGLLCCSRCHAAWYCNINCQKAHYRSGHKKICLSVAKNLKEVEKMAIPLRNTPFGDNPEPQNIFETQVGRFNDDIRTLGYMYTRRGLVESYFHAAHDVEIKEVWEKALFHALGLLREDGSDPHGMVYITPFILLYLNRDDDAFDCIRHWVNAHFIRDRETAFKFWRRQVESKEGDWFYPSERNSRFQDIFGACPEASDQDVLLAFLVALLIIKLRLVAAYDATSKTIDLAFNETTGGQRIQEVKEAVKEMLIVESMVNIESQRQQVERLVDIIHRSNPSMLPAILNPRPLLKQFRPPPNFRGDPSEVYDILNYCSRCFLRIPGAQRMLEEMFGPNPTYDTDMRYDSD